MVTVDELINYHTTTCNNARMLIAIKGHDYSKISSETTGDTLGNLRLPKLLGVTTSNTQTILTRLIEKYSRLISLTLNPNTEAHVKDETVGDTINDCINFLVYLKYMYEEEREYYKQINTNNNSKQINMNNNRFDNINKVLYNIGKNSIVMNQDYKSKNITYKDIKNFDDNPTYVDIFNNYM